MKIKKNRIYRLVIGDSDVIVHTVKAVTKDMTIWDCKILISTNTMYLKQGEIGQFDIGWFAEELGAKDDYAEYFI